ncbi:MAG: MCP four helix bundle domain-containing protein [Planctomycetia bacterium]|nr:MCP four helix bundle domain-containing protein [Planctomycetia bacterium]
MRSRLMMRMIAPVVAISLLLVTLGGTAAWYVHRLQKQASDVLALNVASVRAAEELEISLLEVRSLLKDYAYTGEPQHLEAVPPFRRQADQALREAELLATTAREQELIAEIKQGYGRFTREFDRLAARERPDAASAEQVRTLLAEVLTKDILRPAREYRAYNETTAARNSAQNQAISRQMALSLVLLGSCGAVAGLLAGYGIARNIAHSIGKLSRPIQDAAGKLNQAASPVAVSPGQELQDLEANLLKVAQQAGTVVARLHHSEREVLRAEQLAAVGQMAAGLAHELRNPLMAMKILVQPAAAPDAAVSLSPEDLAVLHEEITRLERSIQTFLDFARPPQPEKRPFEARAVVEQAAYLVSGRAEQRGVRVECDVPGQPVVIEADMVQVRQVLLNLLLNALDATPEGGTVRIEILPREDDEPDAKGPVGEPCPGEWLTVQVADTGCGLPAELGPRIFEPFVSTKDTGMGLGLSICKRIVEMHGGQIAADPRSGGGAVFTIRLPLHAAPAAPDARPPAPPARAVPSTL